IGLIVLSLYLAVYFGMFGWLVHRISHLTPHTLHLILIPSAWVALEYLRSHWLSGLGWNLLGYSQTSLLPLIQLADVTGVWGISFVVVLVNVAIAEALGLHRFRKKLRMAMSAAGCVTLLWSYGHWRLTQPLHGPSLKVAVVQGNIPQDEKWDEAFQQSIVERYSQLTRQAAAADHPQLIIWPETAVPDILDITELLPTSISLLARSVQTPLLVGTPMGHVTAHAVSDLTNSAVSINVDGVIRARYDKLHLVPFGEFIPFESICPWLRTILPPIGTFTPGHDFTVFQLDSSRPETQGPKPGAWSLQPRFSVLICFEDLFPDLARQFVQRGAWFLATITNDAWFGNTAAAYQHAQASTFRAVELRVPMVRAANTGWSGCIDAHGRWLNSVHNTEGQELFVEGVAVCEVTVGNTPTVYRRWGDWFAWLCMLGCLGGVIFAIMKR
ncbi:MAG: apolipoprotein N-acyltransferase, partial [Candidatus Omnitrophica bacterium]|nr:apolipoprotein N-acyltransferase [Candidatus Omnitrophota bacterium]